MRATFIGFLFVRRGMSAKTEQAVNPGRPDT
jgi:hypothetical protein